MGKKLIIDLNDYQKIESSKEADVLLIPAKIGEKQLPMVCYKLLEPKEVKKKNVVTVADVVSGIKWVPTCNIDTTCGPQDYLFLVKWWFESCSKEENRFYIDGLAALFNSTDFREAAKAIRKNLETYHTYQVNGDGKFSARITSIDRNIRTVIRTYERKGWYRKAGYQQVGSK